MSEDLCLHRRSPTCPEATHAAGFYVETDDLQGSLDKTGSLGGSTVTPPTEPMQGTTIALFAEPEGHVVRLVKPGPPPEG